MTTNPWYYLRSASATSTNFRNFWWVTEDLTIGLGSTVTELGNVTRQSSTVVSTQKTISIIIGIF